MQLEEIGKEDKSVWVSSLISVQIYIRLIRSDIKPFEICVCDGCHPGIRLT